MLQLNLNSYSLNLHGFCLDYSTDKERFNFFLDPQATCEHFTELHIIDGWDADKNLEPVILGTREHDYEEEETGEIIFTERPVFIHWCDFVKAFALLPRQLELLAEHHYSQQLHKRIIDKINSLLESVETTELILA